MGIEELLLHTAKKEAFEKAFKQGFEEGREIAANEKNIEFTTNLLLKTDHSIEKIATFMGVHISFVEEIKKSL